MRKKSVKTTAKSTEAITGTAAKVKETVKAAAKKVEESAPAEKTAEVVKEVVNKAPEAVQKAEKTVKTATKTATKAVRKAAGARAKEVSLEIFETNVSLKDVEKAVKKDVAEKGLTAKYSFSDILGKSKAIRENIHMAQRYSRVNSNVLIVGETGTGKELFAHSIHQA